MTVKNHVLNKIRQTEVVKEPFYNLYISDIFPADFYSLLKEAMLNHKYNKPLEQRNWDHPSYISKKSSLKNSDDPTIKIVKDIFSDPEIKDSLLSKFYLNSDECCKEAIMDHDLQFVFQEKNKFQRVHTDIPAQFLSVNFYLPEGDISTEDELNNGTLLYDKELKPHKVFRYQPNSMSCFAPHFYSYHGFNTTIDNRNTMLFFYAHKELYKRFYSNIHNENGEQDVEKFKDVIHWKISQYRLIEYGLNNMTFLTKLLQEKAACKVNVLNGRIDESH